jgi:restriction system protein
VYQEEQGLTRAATPRDLVRTSGSWGRPLALWESDSGELGHQYATDVGRLDFRCRDTRGDTLVVVELKRGRPSDRVVGQAARYMGWVRANLARPGQRVEVLIVAHEQEDRLAYAVAAVPDLSVLTYQIDFRLSTPARPDAIAS